MTKGSVCFVRLWVFLVSFALVGGAARAKPAVFEPLSVDAANKRAVQEKRLVVVDAMAEWCGPCKHMDRTTWVNAPLVEWMKKHCIAVQLDVDKDKAGARRLRISAMPTIVLFADGKEVDRKVGGMNAKQMLEWLQSARKRAGLDEAEAPLSDAQKKQRDERSAKKAAEDRARLDAARKLASEGKHDEATRAFADLWGSMKGASAPDAALLSEAADAMGGLAKKHDRARRVFAGLRDADAPPPRNPLVVMPGDLFRWAALNDALGEGERTLAWYDEARGNPGAASHMLRIDTFVGRELVKATRWDDVMVVVTMAVEAGKVRAEHVSWLEAASAAGATNAELLKQARSKSAG